MTDEQLERVANEVRKGVLVATHAAKSGHPGGSLSAADILTYLYFEEMNVDPADPQKADRDRFVLSKGHAAPGLYSTLAERGYFPKEDLETLRHIGSHLQGHPNMNDTPGVDMTTGSLGQGVSAAVGMALAAKHWGDSYRTYCLLGDGEIEEGQVWEAAMFAGNHALDNLVVIVDHNGLQIDGTIGEVNSAMPIADKFRAFKFHVIELADGNDMAQVRAAFEAAREVKGAPVAIVLTIVMWICGLISKIFAYFRAGMLPILVGVAPMWAAMSWMESGKQAFAKTIGWLAAFLAYKPVAALVMATGSAIMATAGPGDDSQAITLMLTLSVIILLPAMIRVIVPAVQSSVGGGGGGILPSILGMGVAVAGGGLRKAMGGKGGRKGGGDGRGEASPDGARPGAGRGLAGLLSGLGRNGGKPQGANGGGKQAKPLDGNPTGGEPQNTGDQPQGANRKASDGKPQGTNGNGTGSPVPPAPDGASPDPSGGNRPQGTNDAGGFAREGAPDGADRSTTRKGKTF